MIHASITAAALLALAGCTPEVVTNGTPPDAAARDLAARDGARADGSPDLRSDGATTFDLAGALDLAQPGDLATAAPDGPVTCSAQGPLDCSPGTGTGDADQCFLPQKALFADQVNQAIEQVIAAHPDWFDFNTGFACCPKAIQPDLYVNTVVQNVVAQSLCSIRDPNDGHEIVVKLHNDCAENYNILTSGDIVRHPPKYQGACAPAWF